MTLKDKLVNLYALQLPADVYEAALDAILQESSEAPQVKPKLKSAPTKPVLTVKQQVLKCLQNTNPYAGDTHWYQQVELGRLVNATSGHIHTVVKNLEQEGLITIITDSLGTHKKYKFVMLTTEYNKGVVPPVSVYSI